MNSDVVTLEEAREISTEELYKRLSTSRNGLASSDAKNRLEAFGPNEIREKKVSPIFKFLKYFWGPIPWMIEAAVVLSAIIHHWHDFWIILALLMLNAVVGFWQEYKADNAIEALKERLAPKAKVLRDGELTVLPSRELVPGDVIRVRSGDRVPADIKLVEGDYLSADESAMTGESLPVEKHESDIGYAGSIARQGEMTALVVSTGMDTYFGKTAKLVEEAKKRSHFQKAIMKIGNYLIVLAVALTLLIFVVATIRHESPLEVLQFALVLIVAAIPVALPAVLTVSLAIGAIALAKKEAIVSRLASIEEMAGVDILCADKTGTITKNEIGVATIVPFEGFGEDNVLRFGTMASKEEDQDPIDKAITSFPGEGMAAEGHESEYSVLKFKPFDPVSKRTEAEIENADGKRFKVAKGAPQSILSLMGNNEELSRKVAKVADSFATSGYRSLAVAKTDEGDEWQLVGVLALSDPPREDSAKTIEMAQTMGVEVKMVTGDHEAIARQVAREVGLGTNIVEFSAIADRPDNEAKTIVEGADGFARVFPEHKYRIVELLQTEEHIVGMTGDGVNDAPALKKADAGVAVTGSTDAAKSAADIVLTKPGLSVVIDSIRESRKIFQRMNNYAIYRIAETIRVLLFIASSIIIFQFYPVTALMIVLLALLNDAPIMTIAYDNVKYSCEPERWNMRYLLLIATFLGVIGVFSSFIVLYLGTGVLHLSPEVLQSFIYLKLSVAGHLTVFVSRTRGPFWSIKPSRLLFAAVVVTQLVATLITVYGILLPPMGWGLAILVWGYSLLLFLLTDFAKVRVYRFLDREWSRRNVRAPSRSECA